MKSYSKHLLLGLIVLSLWSCASSPSGSPQQEIPGPHEDQQMEMGFIDIPQEKIIVHTGLDVLEKMGFEPLLGKNVGVVTNHTAVNKKGAHLVDLLHANSDISIKAIFAPEHGFRGKEQGGDAIPGSVDANTGAPIHSLYGAQREPNPEMLRGIDVPIFDIQDC